MFLETAEPRLSHVIAVVKVIRAVKIIFGHDPVQKHVKVTDICLGEVNIGGTVSGRA
jgi:hypothetical protein